MQLNQLNDTELTDTELTKQVQNNDISALYELMNRHAPLINQAYSKFAPIFQSSGIPIEDAKQDSQVLIYNAAKSYNEEKGSKFTTWLSNNIRWDCLNRITNAKEMPYEFSVLEGLVDDIRMFEDKNEDLKEFIISELSKLEDKRILEIFMLKFYGEKNKVTWREIEDKMDICSPTRKKLYDKGRLFLQRKLNNENQS